MMSLIFYESSFSDYDFFSLEQLETHLKLNMQ